MNLVVMSNLFDSFDPMTKFILLGFMLPMNWISLFLPLVLIILGYWFVYSRVLYVFVFVINSIYDEFDLLISNTYRPNIIVFISLFVYITLVNLFGLLPYIFTSTSHLSVNLIISLSMWFSFNFYGYLMSPIMVLSHLVPNNTPVFLMNFMVLIEFVSNLIRPLTLSVRLTANLVSGHLLLTLLGSFMSNSVFLPLIMSVFVQCVLFILEIFMAFIQAYVFSVLMTLYFTEFK